MRDERGTGVQRFQCWILSVQKMTSSLQESGGGLVKRLSKHRWTSMGTQSRGASLNENVEHLQILSFASILRQQEQPFCFEFELLLLWIWAPSCWFLLCAIEERKEIFRLHFCHACRPCLHRIPGTKQCSWPHFCEFQMLNFKKLDHKNDWKNGQAVLDLCAKM